MTNPRRRFPEQLLLPGLALCLGLAWTSPARAQTTYGGRAFGAFVDGVPYADTGELPPGGGTLNASQDTLDVDGLSAFALLASTSGGSGVASSFASLNNLKISENEQSIVEAQFALAEVTADCGGLAGQTTIAPELIVRGRPVAVTGDPNQQVPIPGVGLLVVNEQVLAAGEITVNALHLTLDSGAEFVVASARSDIHGCTTVCHDFVTGGGWIPLGSSRGSFGFNAGFKPNAKSPTVAFNYIDHASGMHVKATGITSYVQGATPATRHFEGSASIDGQPGSYAVDVTDNGEPGRFDVFAISLSTGYSASDTLAGGNIQLHGQCGASLSGPAGLLRGARTSSP